VVVVVVVVVAPAAAVVVVVLLVVVLLVVVLLVVVMLLLLLLLVAPAAAVVVLVVVVVALLLSLRASLHLKRAAPSIVSSGTFFLKIPDFHVSLSARSTFCTKATSCTISVFCPMPIRLDFMQSFGVAGTLHTLPAFFEKTNEPSTGLNSM
jgi:hypothetical protein